MMLYDLSFEYKFNASEAATLAKFLRKNISQLPVELMNFTRALENAIYDCMSVQEAERFYRD